MIIIWRLSNAYLETTITDVQQMHNDIEEGNRLQGIEYEEINTHQNIDENNMMIIHDVDILSTTKIWIHRGKQNVLTWVFLTVVTK